MHTRSPPPFPFHHRVEVGRACAESASIRRFAPPLSLSPPPTDVRACVRLATCPCTASTRIPGPSLPVALLVSTNDPPPFRRLRAYPSHSSPRRRHPLVRIVSPRPQCPPQRRHTLHAAQHLRPPPRRRLPAFRPPRPQPPDAHALYRRPHLWPTARELAPRSIPAATADTATALMAATAATADQPGMCLEASQGVSLSSQGAVGVQPPATQHT